MKTLQIGIIGCGSFIIRRILPAIQKLNNTKVVHIQKRDFKKAEEIARQFMIPRFSSQRNDLLNDPAVNFIIIGSQNHCHEEDALAAAASQKPTLCEKPLSLTYESALRMINAFEKTKTPFFVGHSLRFKPAVQMAKKILSKDLIGELINIRAHFSIPQDPLNWRLKEKSGGSLFDVGVHLIDLIRYLSEDEVDIIKAIERRDSENSPDLTVLSIGKLRKNTLFSFECSLIQPLSSGFEVIGSEGKIVSQHSLRQVEENQSSEKFFRIDEKHQLHEISLPYVNIYEEEMKHLENVILNDQPSIISAIEGLKNQNVMQTILNDVN